MRVLLVGGGGREHALAWSLSRSAQLSALYCAPGNAGTAALGTNLPLAATDIEGVLAAARQHRIDLVIVGPEDPLAAGMVDALAAAGIAAFGPTRAATEIEASKEFAKTLMQEAGVPTAQGRAFTDAADAHAYIDAALSEPPVIKANGLAAGKGVIVPASMAEAHAAVDTLLGGRFGEASRTVVVEEHLRGLEASAMAFVDGDHVTPMPFSCDYKRALDGDAGPNTGGMGVYSPPGFLDTQHDRTIFDTVHVPVIEALRNAGRPFRGILYAGLMVRDGQPTVVEFNARFGDPETQVVLPLLESDLLNVMRACVEGRLDREPVRWRRGAAVGVVLASAGYPGAYETGKPITGLDTVDQGVESGVLVFHAGTQLRDDGTVVTSGGRVLTVVAIAPTLAEARERAYANAARITFEGRQYRTDIALRELAPDTGDVR